MLACAWPNIGIFWNAFEVRSFSFKFCMITFELFTFTLILMILKKSCFPFFSNNSIGFLSASFISLLYTVTLVLWPWPIFKVTGKWKNKEGYTFQSWMVTELGGGGCWFFHCLQWWFVFQYSYVLCIDVCTCCCSGEADCHQCAAARVWQLPHTAEHQCQSLHADHYHWLRSLRCHRIRLYSGLWNSGDGFIQSWYGFAKCCLSSQ